MALDASRACNTSDDGKVISQFGALVQVAVLTCFGLAGSVEGGSSHLFQA
jgi:hypothetical protein